MNDQQPVSDRPALEQQLLAAWPEFREDILASMTDDQLKEVCKYLGTASPVDEELAAVQEFSERHAADIAKTGKTPQQYVRNFQSLRRRKPELTAAQYGVPAKS